MSVDQNLATVVHTHLIRSLIANGKCPTRIEVSANLGIPQSEVESIYSHLAQSHGVVLHPHLMEPWVIHPFSLAPTLNWVEAGNRGWWAPCIWCALGITSLLPGEAAILTRYGAESEPLKITLFDGELIGPSDVLVHFSVPPKNAWDNVHLHCALLLPFHTSTDIQMWCERHGVPRGEAVPLWQAARLARTWYGTHAKDNWHKWSKAEAQSIFHSVGLTSAFWNLGSDPGGF